MGTGSKKVVSLKLDAALLKEVDYHAVDRDQFRSEAVEELIRRGLDATQGSGESRGTQRFD